MRIISGSKKGRRLKIPQGLPVRPTTDFAKESLFNILNNYFNFEGMSIIDLYAGTGSISYEFISRGALQSIAVDQSYKCIKYVEKTSEELDFDIIGLKNDCINFLEHTSAKADIIFADPPYDVQDDIYEKIIALAFSKNLLKADGSVIIEHHSRKDLSELNHFSFYKEYGNSAFSFFNLER